MAQLPYEGETKAPQSTEQPELEIPRIHCPNCGREIQLLTNMLVCYYCGLEAQLSVEESNKLLATLRQLLQVKYPLHVEAIVYVVS